MPNHVTRQIILAYLDGLPMAQIARDLTNSGVRTSRGKPWSDKAVSRKLNKIKADYNDEAGVLNLTHGHLNTMIEEIEPPTKPPKYLLTSKLRCREGHHMLVANKLSKKYNCSQCQISVSRGQAESCLRNTLASLSLSPDYLRTLSNSPLDLDAENRDACLGDFIGSGWPPNFLAGLDDRQLRQLVDIIIEKIIYDPECLSFEYYFHLPSLR